MTDYFGFAVRLYAGGRPHPREDFANGCAGYCLAPVSVRAFGQGHPALDDAAFPEKTSAGHTEPADAGAIG
jgi:hypothetical protein